MVWIFFLTDSFYTPELNESLDEAGAIPSVSSGFLHLVSTAADHLGPS